MGTELCIGYMLPKGVGITLRQRDPKRAYETIRAWLTETTVCRFGPDVTLMLRIPLPDRDAGARLAALDRELGDHRISGGEFMWPEEVRISESWEWKVAHGRLGDLFDLVASGRLPLRAYGCRIGAWADFLLLDENGQVLPGQSFEGPDRFYSWLALDFADKCSIVLDQFRFPFEQDGPEFRKVYDAFKAAAPFHMNDKYLRLCRCQEGRLTVRKLPGWPA